MQRPIIVAALMLSMNVSWASDAVSLTHANELYAAGAFDEAFPLYRQLAEEGNPEAQRQLAYMYSWGFGIDKDEARAACWFRRAAQFGDAKARDKLLEMLDTSQGSSRDQRQIYALLQMQVAGNGSQILVGKARKRMEKMVASGFESSSAELEPKDVRQRCLALEIANAQTTVRRSRDGHFYLDGTVNRVSVRFLIDTGATSIVISERVAAAAGLTGGRPVRVSTANGVVQSREVDGVTLSAGRIQMTGLSVVVGRPGNDPWMGLLGQEFLDRFDMSISGDELTLKPRAR